MGDPMVNRREFIASTAFGAAGLALAPLAACSQNAGGAVAPAAEPAAAMSPPTAPTSPGDLLMRGIPATGERIPAIGVGTSGSYEVVLDSAEYEALKDVMRVFFEGGGRVLDTSPNYSNAEDVVGALLADGGWREQCFLATKLAADDRAALEAQWAASLSRLQTDHVELLQVHNLRNWEQALPYARELKAGGKTKYIGLCL